MLPLVTSWPMPDNPKRPATKGTRKGNGPGMGHGWGGQAKGKSASNAEMHAQFEPGNAVAVGPHDMSDRDRIAALKDNLYDLAFHADNEATRVQASTHLLNRLDGMPIARNINVNADDLSALSDADIAAELARLGSSGTETPAGDAASSRKARLGGVVH